MQSLLEFQDVSYRYPNSDRFAVQQLSFQILAGQKTAIVGHNGCGKSTLLFLADGLYRVNAGTIRWQGEPLKYHAAALNHWRQRIGLSFQDPERQLVAATVSEDISYGLCNLQLSKSEIAQRLQQTLIDFSLKDLEHCPIHHLSLGQKRRVALAGVMALQPELLLLDEPTAYLDKRQTSNLFRELDRIHDKGTTIAIATHDLDLVYAWADWVVVLDAGRVILVDRTEAVFSNVALLEQLQLGLPTLLEIWSLLPESMRQGTPPRTISQWREHCQ